MIVSKKANLAFIHIPKNAGRSVEQAMRAKWPCKRVGWGHSTLSQDRKKIKGLETFAVVRNPFERMVSLYFFILQKKKHSTNRKGKRVSIENLREMGFSKWLRKCGELTGGIVLTETPQVAWLRVHGKVRVDHIFRYENLGELKKIGIELEEHAHKSKHGHYSEYYDAEAIAFVENKFREDLETFGYEYENKHRD